MSRAGRTTFQFPPSKLRGVLLFAGKDDIRYYLNGVYFTKAPNGQGMIAVATDGHRLTVIYHKQDVTGVADGFECIAPRVELEQAAKAPVKGKGFVLDVAFSVERKERTMTADESHPGATVVSPLVVTMKSSVTVEAQAIEGKFPDFQKVIPPFANRTPSAITCSAEYLADYHKLAQALGKKHCAVTLSTNGETNSVLVDIGEIDVVSVLMPMRGEATDVDRDWLKGSAA